MRLENGQTRKHCCEEVLKTSVWQAPTKLLGLELYDDLGLQQEKGRAHQSTAIQEPI